MFKKTWIFFLFAFLFLLTHQAFFWLFQTKLGLPLSVVPFFASLIVALFFISIAFIHLKIVRVFVCLSYGLLLLYSLVNFAYYRVFRVFWQARAGQVFELKASTIELLSDYAPSVPISLYLLAFFSFCFLLLLFVFSFSAKQDGEGKHLRALVPVATLFFGAGMLFFLVEIANQDTRLGRRELMGKLGPLGYQVFEVRQKWSRETTALAASGKPEAQQEASVLVKKTDWQRVKDQWQFLKLFAGEQAGPSRAASKPILKTKPHVIIFQMESVAAWPLKENPSPMPFLQSLINTRLSAKQFYANSCTTINAEFSTLCSLIPESGGPVSDLFSSNQYACLPQILDQNYGYKTVVHHANKSDFWNRDQLMPAWGIQDLRFTPTYFPRESDKSILHKVVLDLEKAQSPQFHYVIGFTSHSPHNQELVELHKERNGLEIKPYEAALSPQALTSIESEQTLRNYLGFLKATDDAIKQFFGELEGKGLLDDTVVVMFGDHRYYSFDKGSPEENFYQYNLIPFAMHIPGLQKWKQPIASFIDIAPTLLDLIDPKASKPANFLGQSLVSPQAAPSFAVSTCLGEVLYMDTRQAISGDLVTKNFFSISPPGEGADSRSSRSVAGPLYDIVHSLDQIFSKNLLAAPGQEVESANVEPRELDLTQMTDADKDGLSDLREVGLGTDKKNPDTDGDGRLDGLEVLEGTNPFGEGEWKR